MKRDPRQDDISFEKGATVRLSELGRQRCPKLPHTEGLVIGFARSGRAFQVQFYGRVTAVTLHGSYLEQVDLRVPQTR